MLMKCNVKRLRVQKEVQSVTCVLLLLCLVLRITLSDLNNQCRIIWKWLFCVTFRALLKLVLCWIEGECEGHELHSNIQDDSSFTDGCHCGWPGWRLHSGAWESHCFPAAWPFLVTDTCYTIKGRAGLLWCVLPIFVSKRKLQVLSEEKLCTDFQTLTKLRTFIFFLCSKMEICWARIKLFDWLYISNNTRIKLPRNFKVMKEV